MAAVLQRCDAIMLIYLSTYRQADTDTSSKVLWTSLDAPAIASNSRPLFAIKTFTKEQKHKVKPNVSILLKVVTKNKD